MVQQLKIYNRFYNIHFILLQQIKHTSSHSKKQQYVLKSIEKHLLVIQ